MTHLRGMLWQTIMMAGMLSIYGCSGPVCRWKAAHPHARQLTTRGKSVDALPTAAWAQLLLRGQDFTCAGAPIAATLRHVPTQKLEHQVFIDAAGEGRHLVWLKTHGDAQYVHGTVALVEGDTKYLRAYAVGLLTLPRGEALLNYHYGDELESLWATSVSCSPHKALGRPLCRRVLQVLPRQGAELLQVGRPIVVFNESARSLGAGWHRVSKHEAHVAQQQSRLVVRETTDEHERMARRASVAPRQRRTSRATWSQSLIPPA